ncbi:MAG: hypothetical protein Q9160_006511 [Pyrenula sp. 1 TL-2023]
MVGGRKDRPLRQCKAIYDELLQRRRLFQSQPVTPYNAPPILPQPIPTTIPQKRPPPGVAEPQTPAGRAIQPRPSLSEPVTQLSGGIAMIAPSQTSPGEWSAEQTKKKRGRPSKADKDAAIAAGTYQPSKKRPPKKPSASPGGSAVLSVSPGVSATLSEPSGVPTVGTPGTPNPTFMTAKHPPHSPESQRVQLPSVVTAPSRDAWPPLAREPQPQSQTTMAAPLYPANHSPRVPVPRLGYPTSLTNPPFPSPISATDPRNESSVNQPGENTNRSTPASEGGFPTTQSRA